MEEKIIPAKKAEGKLEGILTLVGGLGLAIFHSNQIYNLMEKAGYFQHSSQPPAYPNMNTLDYHLTIMAVTMGTFSLFGAGAYIGNRIGRFLDKKLR